MKSLTLSMGSVVAIALQGGLVACGGASQPAETPGAATASLENPPPPATGGATTAASSTSPEPAPTAELNAGIKAFDAGNFEEAKNQFQAAAKKNPRDYQALFNLGQTCEKLGDKACAESSYKGALAAKPELDSAAALLSALYVDGGRIDDALAVAKQGLAKHPGSGPLHEALGVGLAAQKQQDLATKEFLQAIQISPNDPMFHYTFAHWLNIWHDGKDAGFQLDAAVPLVKDDYALLASIGFEYRMAGQFDTCVKIFDRAIHTKDGGEVRTERGLCKMGLKDEKGALEDLQAAVSTEPNYPTGHYYLAGRLAAMKRFKEAAAEYNKYLQLDPDGSLAGKAKERLELVQKAIKDKK
jgi:tetratricopeptide (TPR) repeat protein